VIQVVHPTVSEEFVNPAPPLFDWRERLNTPKDARVVLFIANNYEHKGLDLVFDAVNEILKTKEIYLWVGGRGNVPKYEAKAKKMGIGDFVRFTGMIKQNLPHLYRSADLFVLPSKFDTFGIVVIESLACGLPVIISRNCGAISLMSSYNKIGNFFQELIPSKFSLLILRALSVGRQYKQTMVNDHEHKKSKFDYKIINSKYKLNE
jgi:UDP-glucose:(heptosyl)LPS alpha-1,3-glucosyltransferase